MRCSFENCNSELHKKTKSEFCPRHRRVMYTRKWSTEHKEYAADRYQKNKEQIKARLKAIPKEQLTIKNTIWYQNNKELAKKISAVWAKNNPYKRANISAKYRAYKLRAIPKWLNSEQKLAIELFYKNRPNGFHVDHIIPLQGQEVRGLHVPWNLQYLTVSKNCSKGNR